MSRQRIKMGANDNRPDFQRMIEDAKKVKKNGRTIVSVLPSVYGGM